MQAKQLPITNNDSGSSHGGLSASEPVKSTTGYWRSVDELEQTPEFEEFLHREFPKAASEFPAGVSRRRWLKLMSASLALGGVAGCRYGPNEFAAFVVRPEDATPGRAKHYATNFELAGRAVHLLVSNLDGRPIKIEGNPEHPLMRSSEPNDLSGGKSRFASAGTDVFSQGCILGLYDPDRLKVVTRQADGVAEASSWEAFAAFAKERLGALQASQGESLAILMSPSLSPSVNRLVGETVKLLPKATVAVYSSLDQANQQAALAQAAGKPAELLFDLSVAKVICCLDSDLLGNDPNMLVYSRQFAKGRTPALDQMSRLYAVEARFSITGAAADSRLAVRSSQIGAFLAQLEQQVDNLLAGGSPKVAGAKEAAFDSKEVSPAEQLERFVDAMAEDLVKHKGEGLVSVGAYQPLEVQLAALRLNQKLENIGKGVQIRPSRSAIEGVAPVTLSDLTESLVKGAVDTVWILGDNPAYTAPGNLKFADALSKVPHSVYLAEFGDETANVCKWNVPLAHPLESWSDVLGVDGSYGVGQPQILPLLGGKSQLEILSLLVGQAETGEAIVKATAGIVNGNQLAARQWQETLHSGFLAGVASEPLSGSLNVEGATPSGTLNLESIENGSLEIIFTISDTLYDGRFAKNVWMQELPQAMTKLVWDNAAIMSPAMATKLNLKQGEIVRLVRGDATLELPVFLMPGQAHGSITVHLGYGRVCRDEAVDSNEQVSVGKDVAPLRTFDNPSIVTGVEARSTSRPYKLVTTQDHFAIDKLGLDTTAERAGMLIREGTVEQITEGGGDYVDHLGIHHPPLESLWEEPMKTFESDPTVAYQWGMAIDLNKCTGCNSCVVACQSENNISVVGKEQVSHGREMHWIRVDRYFRGEMETPQIVNQPVACVHCETAPCEQVCPVAATVHTEEGINAMTYNRCVGTRYCANNCPYKVRRFNYFNYNTEYGYFYGWKQKGKLEEASRQLQQLVLNPEVTVRGRGVMEKCTYCIQRVQNGKIHARNEGRAVEDGEIQSACQTACPTQAIVFGDLKDPSTQVSKLQNDVRAYAMLGELNIKPRTLYLARVRNTHPRLKLAHQLLEAHHDAHGASHGEEHAAEHAAEASADGAAKAEHSAH
jgi:MoCo/4Fe-4S cofactor protein with predicted Tat translocation signal